jgi:hypothetical protein
LGGIGSVFRVYLWEVEAVTSHEYEITEADVGEVIDWAKEHTLPGWTNTVYVVAKNGEYGRGLIRISGVVGDPFAGAGIPDPLA